MEKGMEKGLRKGREQGVRQERKDIALRMLEKGMGMETIADLTGMDVEEVRKLSEKFRAKE